MAISYEEALKAQRAIEDQLLEDPNVVSVGVVEETDNFGRKTGNYAIKVGVISAEIYQNALNHGESIIPQEYILRSKEGTHEIKHVHIQVVKTGQIEALFISNGTDFKDLPSAMDEIPAAPLQTLDDHTSRRRPSPCGQSIGHPSVTAGTQGLLLEYVTGPNAGKAYILSNNHVLAANNSGFVGDSITQPGRHDLGVVGNDTIAILHRWIPLEQQHYNFIDAAIAEVSGGLEWKKFVSPHISKIGYPDDITDAQIAMSVEKTGRTTGYTQGKILSVSQTLKVNYGKMGVIKFKDQICTTNMSKGGDSGACLFAIGTRKPVGLLFAGGESESFFNPIRSVLSSLSMSFTNKYPSGNTHVFAKDYPLRIIKRNYATTSSALPKAPDLQITRMGLRNFSPLSPLKRGLLLASFGLYTANIARQFFNPAQPVTSPLADRLRLR